jgi:nucleoside-diphosphate-sugar epimerase
VLLRDFVQEMAALLGGTALLRFGARKHRTGEMASVVADVHRLHALLGERPRIELAEGLRRMGADVVAAA